MKLYRVIVMLAIVAMATAAPAPPSGFDHHMVIVADIYNLYWSVKGEEIHFEVQVKTLGYVGFGISKTGGMVGADIVTAWVKDDLVYFQDRHSDRNGEPPIDKEQNWFLIEGRESDGYTIIRFKRPLISCDKKNDFDINGETMKLIYAFHPTDPQDAGSIVYHGADRRGTKSVTLVLHGPQKNSNEIPEHTGYVDFLNPNVTLPAKPTTYWCQAFKLPELDKKHQVVRVEPIIQPGHEGIVHHILLYACYHEFDEDSHEGRGAECYNDLMGEVEKCTGIFNGWAIGGNANNYPLHVGHPIGKGHLPKMLRMETHYDNPPPSKSGIVDASGLRIYYTDKLREYDAGMIEVGAATDKHLVIPPRFDKLTSQSHCSAECLSAVIPEKEDIKIFGGIVHTHLLGARIVVRHFRDGKELAPIVKDDYYDFNYQDLRIFPKEVSVKPNDHIITECDYNSAPRKNITWGGLGTTEEMCLAFLLYYPKKAFSLCLSLPVPAHIVQFVNPNISVKGSTPGTENFYFNITGPAEYAGKNYQQVLESIDWNDAKWRKKYQDNMLKSEATYVQLCSDGFLHPLINNSFLKVPKFESLYKAPVPKCYEMPSSGFAITASIFLSLILALLNVL